MVSIQPVTPVWRRDIVTFETDNCFEGQIQTPQDWVTNLHWDHIKHPRLEVNPGKLEM